MWYFENKSLSFGSSEQIHRLCMHSARQKSTLWWFTEPKAWGNFRQGPPKCITSMNTRFEWCEQVIVCKVFVTGNMSQYNREINRIIILQSLEVTACQSTKEYYWYTVASDFTLMDQSSPKKRNININSNNTTTHLHWTWLGSRVLC